MNQALTQQLWGDFHDGLWRFIRARVRSDADADDVLQNVFLKVHTRGDQIRDDERVAGWIFRIASNAVVDHHRSSAARPDRDVSEPAVATPDTPFEVDEAALLAQCVRPFVDNLEPHYRDALLLTEFEGMTQAEAAKEAGVSVSGMKSRVQRGRVKLRDSLEQCCAITLDARRSVTDVEPLCDPVDCGVNSTHSGLMSE